MYLRYRNRDLTGKKAQSISVHHSRLVVGNCCQEGASLNGPLMKALWNTTVNTTSLTNIIF